MRRRMTPAERAKQSERMRAAWASGKFAGRARMRHARAWSAAEDAMLRDLAGTLTPAELAERLSATGMPRTETAVLVRLKRLGLSPVVRHHTARSLGALFGVDPKTVTHSWVRRGRLHGDRLHDLPGGSWVFHDDQVEAFIREHGHAYDWRRMRPGRWRSLAETLDRQDPLLTAEQAARALGASVATIRNHCARGWLPSLRRPLKGGARSGLLLIRRSDLKLFAYRRPCLVGKSGRPRRERGKAA